LYSGCISAFERYVAADGARTGRHVRSKIGELRRGIPAPKYRSSQLRQAEFPSCINPFVEFFEFFREFFGP
jgi:hypothetical protein